MAPTPITTFDVMPSLGEKNVNTNVLVKRKE
jgi:hypothetical protein